MTLTPEQTAELDRMRANAETGERWAEVCKREAEMLAWLDASEAARKCHDHAVSSSDRPDKRPDAVAWQHMSAYYAKQARNLAGRE